MRWKNEREFDRALGVDTALTDTDWSQRRQHPCQPTPLAALEALVLRLSPEDHVADCGCGTGRAVFYLAHEAGCRVTGIELDRRRMAQTRENLRRCARKQPATAARIELIEGAAQACLPGYASVLYFFNPFPASVLRSVLKRVRRPVRLMCYYPDDEWCDVLRQTGWTRTERIDLQPSLGADPRERIDIWMEVEK